MISVSETPDFSENLLRSVQTAHPLSGW